MNSRVSPGRKNPISSPHSANRMRMMPSTAHEPIALIMFPGSSQPGSSARYGSTTFRDYRRTGPDQGRSTPEGACLGGWATAAVRVGPGRRYRRSMTDVTATAPATDERHRALLADLRAVLGESGVVDDPDIVEGYRHDMMPLAPAGRPIAVVFPSDTDEVVGVVRACAAAGVPIVPRGAGSGLTGAANAVDGAVTAGDDEDEQDPRDRRGQPAGRRPARRGEPRLPHRGGVARPVLRARPVVATTGAPSAATCRPTPAACVA